MEKASRVNPQQPGRILVVDDEQLSRELLQVSLQSDGHSVKLAASGERALEIIEAEPPDLILTDVRMHGMSGYELCAQLKSDPATQHIPVLLYTGLTSDEDKQAGIAAGADDFIRKPIDIVIMLHRVRTLLRLKYLHDQLRQQTALIEAALMQHVDPETARRIMLHLQAAQL